MLSSLDKIREMGTCIAKLKSSGQTSLFGEEEKDGTHSDTLPQIEEFEKSQKLAMEKELLGFYLTEHPNADKLALMGELITHRISQLYSENLDGQRVTIGGIVEACRLVTTKANNQQMCFAKIADSGKSVEVVVFPKVFATSGDCWRPDNLVLISGRVESKQEEDESDQTITIITDSAKIFDGKITTPPPSQTKAIYIPKGLAQSKLVALNTLLSENKGKTSAELIFETKTVSLPYGLNWNDGLVKAIDLLLK